MKKYFFTFALLILILSNCGADGMTLMPMPDYRDTVFLPEQKALITWDGTTEELILESKITSENITDIAWLIPIESSSKPVVEAADEQVFYSLSDLFAVMPKGRGFGVFSQMAMDGVEGVEVVEELKVDIYDVTILKATDGTALITWLNQNGYYFPKAFPNLLEEYTSRGNTYFIANKINLENKYPGINPTSKDFECVVEVSKSRRFDYGYMLRSGGISAEQIRPVIDNFEECDGTNAEAVAALVTLRRGIATPLKISFTPSRPFYPMKLSSLNLGEGTARVYFAGKTGFKDSSGLFETKNMVQVSGNYLSEHGINDGDVVTLLTWEGSYPSLEGDSFFAEIPFDPALDPNYVPPEQIFLTAAFAILMVLVMALVMFAIPFIIIPFAIGIALAWVFERKHAKKSFFHQNPVFAWIAAIILALFGPGLFLLIFVLPLILMGSLAYVNLLAAVGVLAFIFLVAFTPYFASMACGFFFKKSKFRKIFLLGPVIIFLVVLLLIMFISGSFSMF